MSSDDVLRQLLWKHENTLAGLARELGGHGAACQLRDLDGNPVWDSTITESAMSDSGPSLTVGWHIPLSGIGSLEVRARTVPVGAPVQLPSLGTFLVGSMESEEELDRLVEDHIANTNQLVALYHIIEATHETWNLADKLEVMLEEAGRQIGTSLAFLKVVHEGEVHFAIWPGEEAFRRERAEQLLARCQEESDAFVGAEGEAFVAAPILVRDEIVGWLGAGERPVGDPLGQRDLKHLSALAELTAGFLQTARLQDQIVANTKLQRELEIASQIQDMLMPRELPQMAGLGVSASCRPASSVGGDFFVVQELPDGRLAFALGDVTGKGVPAALIMAMARTVFRSLTPLSGGAGVVLERLSQVLYDDLEEVGKFVTLVLGFWDPKLDRLEIANAGHSPVLFRPHAGAKFISMEPDEPPVGVLPNAHPSTVVLEFGPGAVFLACSDGVTEARDPDGGFYGDDRLHGLIDGSGSEGAESLRRRILEDVETFADGAAQSDDQTILVLTRVESPVPSEPLGTVEVSLSLAPEVPALRRMNQSFDRAFDQVLASLEDVSRAEAIGAVAAEMKLALHEALANLIEHGGIPEAEPIEVRLRIGSEGIGAEIECGGSSFDPNAVCPHPPRAEELSEGGYGLHLMHTLTDRILYEPGGKRHRMYLSRTWRSS